MEASNSPESSLKPMNPGTRKLIRHRCEGQVRGSVLRWAGLPIGGTSAVAFFITLFIWIPQQLKEINLSEFSHDLLSSYVQQVVSDNVVFQEQLEAAVRNTVRENTQKEVTVQIESLSKERVGQALAAEIKSAVSREVDKIGELPEMKARIAAAATETLQNNDYDLLRKAMLPNLKLISKRVSEKIAENAQQTIQKVSNPLAGNQIIDKRSYQELNGILNKLNSNPPQPTDIFALRFYIAAGSEKDHHYISPVILRYLEGLTAVLGNQLRYALILDSRMQFIALSDIDTFGKTVKNKGHQLEEALNKRNLSINEVKQSIVDLLGPESIEYVDQSIQIKQALKKDSLRKSSDPSSTFSRHVAVVANLGGAAFFQGVTSRRNLLEALLP